MIISLLSIMFIYLFYLPLLSISFIEHVYVVGALKFAVEFFV